MNDGFVTQKAFYDLHVIIFYEFRNRGDGSLIWNILPWLAIICLSAGYWLQVLKIIQDQKVRGLSFKTFILLSLGFGIMGIRAYHDQSLIFLVKQIATMIPCLGIVTLIIYFRKKEKMPRLCYGCKDELEDEWQFCPACGARAPFRVFSSSESKDSEAA